MKSTHKFAYSGRTPFNLTDRFSNPVFRGTLKTRDGGQRLGRLKLDADTALELGSNHVGLFIDSCPSFERMVENFFHLADCADSIWVIVASSLMVKEQLVSLASEYCSTCRCEWPSNVRFHTPEELDRNQTCQTENLAAILVFDYACHIHKCRGCGNDRPQKLVDFRMGSRVGAWSPPVIFFTNRKAVAVNTIPMLSPYCLEAFRYIDGVTMRFGELKGQIAAPS